MRKTLPVATIVDRANHFLAHSVIGVADERKGVASFLEALLTDADAYAGFSYLNTAGVNYDGIAAGQPFEALDDTRRQYNVHRKLI
jgi:hypothetical protein